MSEERKPPSEMCEEPGVGCSTCPICQDLPTTMLPEGCCAEPA